MPDKVFHFNSYNFLVPGFFIVGGLIIGSEIPELTSLYYLFLTIGTLTLVVMLLNYKILVITDDEMGIRWFWKKKVISLKEITSVESKVFFSKGFESITWNIFLKNGKKIVLRNDSFRRAKKLKESLNWFLRGIPSSN
ncbi:MAG: hypothetical protein RIM99_04735 [Cyclobacteriaceae bacterium]